MKKIMLAALTLVTVLAFSIPAMSAAINDQDQTITFAGGTTYDLSNSVYMDYVMDDPTDAQYYAIGSVHSGGNRMFVTTSETSVIWWKSCDKGTSTSPSVTVSWTTGNFNSSDWDSL